MSNDHFEQDELMAYLDDPENYPKLHELEQHVAECETCRAQLAEFEQMAKDMESIALWEFAEAVRRTEEMAAAPGETLIDRIAHEDFDAETFLTPLVNSPAAFRRANITAQPFIRTAGAARRLYVLSRELREKQPHHALTLANTSIGVAEQLSAKVYTSSIVNEIRGNAWLERANVLRYQGKFDEAHDALDMATAAYRPLRLATLLIAVVDHVRSTILLAQQRLDEALALSRAAAPIFEEAPDEEHYISAKMVEAAVFYYRHDFARALEMFSALLPRARKMGDAIMLARLYSTIGDSYIAMDNRSQASHYVAQALSLFEALDLKTERVRTRWSLGQLLVASGELPQGIARLRQTATEFEQLGFTHDVALATLDLVEALMLARWTAEVPELCASLVNTFAAAGMTGNALTALSYLNEAVREQRATPKLVRYIREYLPQAQERAFLPPPPIDPEKDPSLM